MSNALPMGRLAGALMIGLALAACSSDRKFAKVSAPDIGPSQVANAATQPVRDLNLMGNEEPGDYLVTVVDNPYSTPPPNCSALSGEIARLDEILGADVDAPREADDDMLGAMTLAAVRNVTRLPFRGVIREVTGAAPRERAMRQALLAGAVRRGYLKGMRTSMNCQPPAPTQAPAAAK